MAFCDLNDNMTLAESFLQRIVKMRVCVNAAATT